MTGEMPTVQPRLPLLFEPAAGFARSVAAPPEQVTRAAPELAERKTRAAPETAAQAPAAVPVRRPRPAAALPAPTGVLPSIESLRHPLNADVSVRPAPARAADETQESAKASSDATPVHENRQPARGDDDLAAPRRGVPVEIRLATANATLPPSSAGTRRGAVAAPINDAARPGRTDGPNGDLPGPPVVHVHIGRVDVRAVIPPAPPARPAARPAAPRPTLEDYLSGRKGGSQP